MPTVRKGDRIMLVNPDEFAVDYFKCRKIYVGDVFTVREDSKPPPSEFIYVERAGVCFRQREVVVIREQEEQMNKSIKAGTLAAVGGCQQEALRKLVEEMGYQITEEPGIYVEVGDTADYAGLAVIIMPALSYQASRCLPSEQGSVSFWVKGSGILDACSADALMSRPSRLTYKGLPVRGYK